MYKSRFVYWRTQSNFGNQTDEFFSDWTRKNFMTTNQENQTKMLKKMHPAMWDKFGNKLELNQKYHPSMTGKILSQGRESKTPNHYNRKKEFISLQGPVQPKPPSFFEQAYKGTEDWRKKNSFNQSRPYSAYRAHDDAKSYMNHQQMKQQKTLNPHYSKIKSRLLKKKEKKEEEEEEWERFNENVR